MPLTTEYQKYPILGNASLYCELQSDSWYGGGGV
jgi:hypothetical protein